MGKTGREMVGRQHPDPPPHSLMLVIPGKELWVSGLTGGPFSLLWPGQFKVFAPGGSPTPELIELEVTHQRPWGWLANV